MIDYIVYESIKIKHHTQPTKIFFMECPTVKNLFLDFEGLCTSLNTHINNLDSQKMIIFKLESKIGQMLDYFKSQMLDYRIAQKLDEVKYFIEISNRTINEFKLKITVKLDEMIQEISTF